MYAVDCRWRSSQTDRVRCDRSQRSTLATFIAGSGSGVVSALVTSPLDVVKIRAQAGGKSRGMCVTLSDIFKAEGIRGLYRGLTPTLSALVPTWGLFFMTYNGMQTHVFGGKTRLSATCLSVLTRSRAFKSESVDSICHGQRGGRGGHHSRHEPDLDDSHTASGTRGVLAGTVSVCRG
jgi:hypothetical protein